MDSKEVLENLVYLNRTLSKGFRKNSDKSHKPLLEEPMSKSLYEKYGVVGNIDNFDINAVIQDNLDDLTIGIQALFHELESRERDYQDSNEQHQEEIEALSRDKDTIQEPASREIFGYEQRLYQIKKKEYEILGLRVENQQLIKELRKRKSKDYKRKGKR